MNKEQLELRGSRFILAQAPKQCEFGIMWYYNKLMKDMITIGNNFIMGKLDRRFHTFLYWQAKNY